MRFSTISFSAIALASAVMAQDVSAQGDKQKSLALDPSQIQTGLISNGQETPTEGQSPSLTSENNFINFCLTRPDLPLTNGKQIAAGSCNPTPMGVIVAQDKIPSVRFQSPKNFGTVPALQNFDIVLKVNNLQTGSFVNPQVNYYGAPGQTNANGVAIGHIHFTMQKLVAIDSTELLDSSKFAFFKGVNGAADAQGNVQATVTGGVAAGTYRICTIVSYSNHQGVLPAVAQRGAMDDCIYITVGDGAAGENPAEPLPEEPISTSQAATSAQVTTTSQSASSSTRPPRQPILTRSSSVAQSSSSSSKVRAPIQTTTRAQTSTGTQTGTQQTPRDGRFRDGRNRDRFRRPERRSHDQIAHNQIHRDIVA